MGWGFKGAGLKWVRLNGAGLKGWVNGVGVEGGGA